MDPICCLLGICCPPAQQRSQVYEALMAEDLSPAQAERVAAWFVQHVTAEKFLLALKAHLAKQHQ